MTLNETLNARLSAPERKLLADHVAKAVGDAYTRGLENGQAEGYKLGEKAGHTRGFTEGYEAGASRDVE